jgi:SAM-dependent methyltransferase
MTAAKKIPKPSKRSAKKQAAKPAAETRTTLIPKLTAPKTTAKKRQAAPTPVPTPASAPAAKAIAGPAKRASRSARAAQGTQAERPSKGEQAKPASQVARGTLSNGRSASKPAARPGTVAVASASAGARGVRRPKAEGWHGWDDYAAFYDWENARTVGRRDVAFWRDVARRTAGRTLELGCGTGRILVPLARAGVDIVGIDRSAPMLARATTRVRRLRRELGPDASGSMLRGDIRQLPFEPATFDLVMAPYGILQSLVRDRDLADTLRAVFAALKPGGLFGLDLVPDVPRWEEYARRISLRGSRGPRGAPVTLVESVRQDRAKRLTIFDQEFIEGRGRAQQTHRFSLTFRTVSIQSLRGRLERAGFTIDAVLGGYDGRPWDPRADTWVLMASKPRT